MLYIVAGNNNEYRSWESKQIHRSETRYVDNPDQIRGMSSIEGLFIGTCYDRHDIVKIVDYVNHIRSRTTKPLIRLQDLSHLSKYATTDHFLNTTTSQSPPNIPVTASQGYVSRQMGKTTTTALIDSYMNGKTYHEAIFDELKAIPYDYTPNGEYIPTGSFKVPLPRGSVDTRTLNTAKMFKSYITNQGNPLTNEYEYYFHNKQDAWDFAKAYDAQAYEYV